MFLLVREIEHEKGTVFRFQIRAKAMEHAGRTRFVAAKDTARDAPALRDSKGIPNLSKAASGFRCRAPVPTSVCTIRNVFRTCAGSLATATGTVQPASVARKIFASRFATATETAWWAKYVRKESAVRAVSTMEIAVPDRYVSITSAGTQF